MSEFYTFPCGCEFKVVGPPPKNSDMPLLDLSTEFLRENIRYDCQAAWDLISSGQTRGVFQVEQPLGRHWCRLIKPSNLDELAALGALLRPGCLNAIVDGKSMTQHYCDRKHGAEPITYLHESLEEILKVSYGILVFQEQSVMIARKIAGFTLGEGMLLQKAISKKKADEMAKMKLMFLEGAKKTGIVKDDVAEELFAWIEKSNRYAFNANHATSYAYAGYWSAYYKCHFTVQFFTSYLKHALDKADSFDEVADLVEDCKMFDIKVLPPDIRSGEDHFNTDGHDIFFGLCDIRGIGEKRLEAEKQRLRDTEQKLGKPVRDWTWLEFLIQFASISQKSFVEPLLGSGACDFFGVTRQQMLFEYNLFSKPNLTELEMAWFRENQVTADWRTLDDALAAGSRTKKENGPIATKKRLPRIADLRNILMKPPRSLLDDSSWRYWMENKLLGIALTANRVECKAATHTCKELLGMPQGPVAIAVEIKRVNKIVTKKGDDMAFLTVSDGTCSFGGAESVVVFPQCFAEHSAKLVEGNIALLRGSCQKQQGKKSFIVENVVQL